MQPTISVITCTHNPRQDYLDQVLTALGTQTLSFDQWEFLLIDNASDRSLAETVDLSWHPHARHLRENQLGLTPARLRGIAEARADLLVLVDDDNVLNADYLETALQISRNWSILGAWGGQIYGEFEDPPPTWTKPYWKYLGIREFNHDRWSNLLHQHDTTPCGSGMCVRKVVAEQYANFVQMNPQRAGLDRKGKTLLSCGDTDLAFTACDLGLGTGQFVALKLRHLIPTMRIQPNYLLQLYENLYYSHTLLDVFRGKLPPHRSKGSQLFNYIRQWKMDVRQRQFYHARQRGIDRAVQELSL